MPEWGVIGGWASCEGGSGKRGKSAKLGRFVAINVVPSLARPPAALTTRLAVCGGFRW